MKALAELLVSFLELIEEEGRTLREKTVRLFLALVMFLVAGVLALAGLGLIVAGAYHWLAPQIGRVAAYFALGGLSLLGTYILLARGRKITRR